ncbi:hypothetical protein [Acinetobacter junii]|uniref:hypothetical protein n=1 Tax=Acinetobacter junii TaxID=40215 RepID=UPI00269364FF
MDLFRHDIHPLIIANLAFRSSIPFVPPLIRSVIVEMSSRSAMNMIEDLLLDDEIISSIKNRKFKKIIRHHDYLKKSVSENPVEIDDTLRALSKVEQLKVRFK